MSEQKSKKKDAAGQSADQKRTATNKARRAANYGKQFNRKSTRAERRANLGVSS